MLPAVNVGPYQLIERIGVGGMAEVFKASQPGEQGFERLVAVKRILPHVAADESFVAMFIDEAKIAVQLSHPNIAQIYDLGRDGETLFIAQEYIHGRDMGLIIDRHKELGMRPPIPFVLHVGLKIAEALGHAHSARGAGGHALNLIHRDVSPQNVLVSFEGAVKVIDFGLAKAQGRLSQTDAGVVKGKLAYLSAEQAQGKAIDSRSDLFSLGTCLFEWLTGERLFYRNNDLETVLAVQKAKVPSMQALRPELSPRIEAFIRRALEADPNRRFQSATQMHDALMGLIYEEGANMRPRSIADMLRGLFPEEFQSAPADREPSRSHTAALPQAAAFESGPMLAPQPHDLAYRAPDAPRRTHAPPAFEPEPLPFQEEYAEPFELVEPAAKLEEFVSFDLEEDDEDEEEEDATIIATAQPALFRAPITAAPVSPAMDQQRADLGDALFAGVGDEPVAGGTPLEEGFGGTFDASPENQSLAGDDFEDLPTQPPMRLPEEESDTGSWGGDGSWDEDEDDTSMGLDTPVPGQEFDAPTSVYSQEVLQKLLQQPMSPREFDAPDVFEGARRSSTPPMRANPDDFSADFDSPEPTAVAEFEEEKTNPDYRP